MMEPREAYILGGVVREYIRTARPVGSTALQHRFNLALSPATIRAILRELEAAGYLVQPHTSAGRVPTDQGYRYYVDHVRLRELTAGQRHTLRQELQRMQEEYRHLARTISKLLSRRSHAMVVSGVVSTGELQEAGLHEVLNQPEGDHLAAVREMSAVLEGIDDYVAQLAHLASETTVFIGKENPFFSAEHISLVVQTITSPLVPQMVLVVVGPKRMHYHRTLSLVQALATIIKQQSL
ncbi:MAG: hypothetical protein WEA04_03025 [Candidatus Andersenbacteria bacterium]